MESTTYKLVYFNLRGRAELARMLFEYAGQKYEDVRVEKDEWTQMKPNTLFGQLPYLEVRRRDGGDKPLVLAQSLAIARYLARHFNLDGRDDAEKAEVEMFAEHVSDISNSFAHAFHTKDEEARTRLVDEYFADKLPNFLKPLEARLKSGGANFLVGNSLTWVDLYLINVYDWSVERMSEALSKGQFEHLIAHRDRVRKLPKIADWIARRPVTHI